jgi:integrase
MGRCGFDGAQNALMECIHVRQGKTESAQRSLPLTPTRCGGSTEAQEAGRKRRVSNPHLCFRARASRVTSRLCSIPHKTAIEDAKLESFEFYCWRHTFGTRAAQSGMDRFTLARLMGHSSPSVAARYYIHVTETHVAAGFGKFVEYQTRNVAEGLKAAFPQASEAVQ